MNKKIIYSILFVSIFLLSTATMIQPVHGYKFGVPDQAKGMEGEGEIKIYDDDEWEKHFGKDGDEPDDIWDGDSDVVGAKSKGVVIDWEEEEESISYLFDFVLQAGIDNEDLPTLDVYEDAIIYIYQSATGLANVTVNDLPVLHIMISLVAGLYYGLIPPALYAPLPSQIGNPNLVPVMTAAGAANATAGAYPVDLVYAKAKYDEEYDGTLLTKDGWDFYEDADYPSKPDDEDDEAPFLADPRDWKDSYDDLWALLYEVYREIDKIYPLIMTLNNTLMNLWGIDPLSWMVINATAAYMLSTMVDPATAAYYIGLAGADLPGFFSTAAYDGMAGVQPMFNTFAPKKAGFLYMQLEGGMPCYTPTDDFLRKVVEEFNIDDENVEIAHPAMEGTIPFTCDVKVEGMVVTMKFEFDDYLDPADWMIDKDLLVPEKDPDELEDWTVVFTYSEYGSQSKVQYMDGDDIFYEKGGVDQIPGFEVSIILGASAISIIALIYVMMKKRKI